MIRVEGLAYRYDDTIAINGVNLTIDDGGCIVVAGANGSGGATLVRHFNGLLDLDKGTVSVNSRTISGHLITARTAIAMTFQYPED